MARPLSTIAPNWWDYTTLDNELLRDAARLTAKDLLELQRPGFKISIYETLEEMYLAEALEYIEAWRAATPSRPAGICGPIGPTEQLPLVARIVNALELDLRHAHFWGMDEWYVDGQAVPPTHPLSFFKADMELCFDRIDPKLRMPQSQIHFPIGDLAAYSRSYDQATCLIMQGGQGDSKHWAFNDPPQRVAPYLDNPPPPSEYRKLPARVTDLHPLTIVQNARTSYNGFVAAIPAQAATVGPVETWKAQRVSIWQPGMHDNPFGMRLTALMISKKLPDSAVPMSLLADHPNVHFHYLRSGIKAVEAEMH